jgi:hypothetical protein
MPEMEKSKKPDTDGIQIAIKANIAKANPLRIIPLYPLFLVAKIIPVKERGNSRVMYCV